MRFLSYLLVIVFAESCSHVTNQAVNYIDETQVSSDAGADGSKHFVPKIKFDTEVSDASVNETIALIAQVTGAGAEAIILEINTPGGSVDAGFRLSKVIEESPVPVVCVVDGMSASMGMYILESCQVRYGTLRSTYMIHEAAIGGDFYAHEVKWRSIADMLRAINKAMAEHLASRMNLSADQILEIIRGGAQWWFGSKEAVQNGAIDASVNSVKELTVNYRECLSNVCQ